MVFNSIKKHNEESLHLYGIDLNEILTGFYNTLSSDDEFIRMFDPVLGNSRQDLYTEYEAKIDSLLLGLINIDDECPMTAYNLMTDDVFLNKWKNELFDMLNISLNLSLKHRKKNSMTKEEKINAWVARDKFDDGLSIYSVVKPKRERGFWGNDGNKGASRMFINKELFPELRWEDEPIEVELIIRKVKK